MGLSATQARYLQLTARKSDYEYQAQQINHSRIKLADELSQIATNYTNAMNNRNLSFLTYSGDGTEMKATALDYNTITAQTPNGLGYKLIDKHGTEVRPNNKKANAIREQALKDYHKAIESQIVFKVDNENGNGQTRVTGDNFATLFSDDSIMDKDGNLVDNKTFQKAVAGMPANVFASYWMENGYEFASGNNFNQEKDASIVEKARAVYDLAMAEADSLENTASIYDDRCLDPEYLEEQLRLGEWTLKKPTENFDENKNRVWEEVHFSSVGQIRDVADTSDDAKASAEYEAKTAYLQQKDKELELQLNQIETSHTALETEIDSLSKVIGQNVERSFKTFG